MANGDISPCCFFYAEDSFYSAKSDRLLDYRNSPQLIDLQDKIEAGERVSSCEYCYQLEDAGLKSPRQDALAELDNDNSNTVTDITLRFSNHCNLACRTCNTFCSTGWFGDAKKISSKIKTEHYVLKNVYPDLQQELESLLPNLKIVHFLGGEPLLDKDHRNLVAKATEVNPGLIIEYNSNLSLPLKNLPEVTKEWGQIKNLILTLSVDGVEKQGEYLRSGLKWDIFDQNLDYIVKELPHAQLNFTITISILNLFHVVEIFRYLNRKNLLDRINLNINPVNNPPYLNIQALPQRVKQQVLVFYDNARNEFPQFSGKFEQIIDYMQIADRSDQFLPFFVMTQHIDRIRGESYLEIFPELRCLGRLK